ncbi:hypothetical protein TCAL_04543 [Tigriopus californicus]|uniref:Uncharacterized protein n=1 Tax=Tigriopus californicus TaxID=6832 RepID=A0A553PRI2_TIGCA|nr:uncharacterized protein LOC131892029 [Tigriopus californicus]TRY80282.1 hypothetical protein TCAL_04543 [Tigriopus californicus]|eukprot:TCALIF_04543-PA protein Name:"Protein of unknown function" AED:0.00 eAED:0.00 QI:206/1/1/1/0.5/0.66/3/67/263
MRRTRSSRFWALMSLSLWAWLMVTSATPLGGGSEDITDSKTDIDNNGYHDGHSLEPTKQGEQEPRQLNAFITVYTTIFETETETSLAEIFESCYTTLVDNLPVCSTFDIKPTTTMFRNRNNQDDIQVIEETVPNLLIQNQPRDFQSFIKASKASNFNASEGQELTNEATANDVILMDEPLIPEIHEEPLTALEWIQSSKGHLSDKASARQICLFGCLTTTSSTTITSVFLELISSTGPTQTLAFTTPGCFPFSIMFSLHVPSC